MQTLGERSKAPARCWLGVHAHGGAPLHSQGRVCARRPRLPTDCRGARKDCRGADCVHRDAAPVLEEFSHRPSAPSGIQSSQHAGHTPGAPAALTRDTFQAAATQASTMKTGRAAELRGAGGAEPSSLGLCPRKCTPAPAEQGGFISRKIQLLLHPRPCP